jgi:hypothetical protein
MARLAVGWLWLRLGVVSALLGAGMFICGEEYQARNDGRDLAVCRSDRDSAQGESLYWQQRDALSRSYFNDLRDYLIRPRPAPKTPKP